MKRSLLLLFFYSSLAYGYIYDTLLLTTQATIFPKIVILDQNIEAKLIDNSIVFGIVYEKEDYATAEKIKNIIRKKFNKKIDKYTLEVLLIPYETLNEKIKATAFYALNSSEKFSKIFTLASRQEVILFSYDLANLTPKEGALITIMNENKTVIYLNTLMLPSYQIEFIDVFYQIVEFTDD